MTKRKKRFLAVCSLLIFIILGGIYSILPYSTGIVPMRRMPSESANWRFPKGGKPEAYDLLAQKISIPTLDSVVLSAWLCASRRDSTQGAVIVLHGISSCKETQFGRAEILADAGYAALLLDLRAHGESGGKYNTFGYHEKRDIQTVVDTLQRYFPGQKIGIWGASLGGAIALQSMENDPRLAFGIIESTFDEYRLVAAEYAARALFGFRHQGFTDHILRKSGEIAAFDPFAVQPMQSAAAIQKPIFFIHGDADDRIPIAMNRRNYEAGPSPHKQWTTVAGGRHADLWWRRGDALKGEVREFLGRW